MNTAVKNEIKIPIISVSGKTTDRTCTKVEQDNTGDDRRQVGVKDSREGVGVTVSQCFLYTLACTSSSLVRS